MLVSPLEVARSQEKPSLASERHGQALNPKILSIALTCPMEDASPVHMHFVPSQWEVRMGFLLRLTDPLHSQVPKARCWAKGNLM